MYNNNSTDYIISQKNKQDKLNNEYQSGNKLNIVKCDGNRRKENKDKIIGISVKNSNLNYFNYLVYLYNQIKCTKTKNNIELYNNIRFKILSEEHLFLSNLNIQLLLKLNESSIINNKDKYILTNQLNFVQN